MNIEELFCSCEKEYSTYIGFSDDIGYWDVCSKCKKRKKDGHHYYTNDSCQKEETEELFVKKD